MNVQGTVAKLKRVPLPVWYGVAAVAGVGVAWYLAKKAASAVTEALDNGAIDITSPNNLAYKGTNQAGRWLFGWGEGDTLGGKIYDWFHEEYDPNAPAPAATLEGHTKSGSVWYGYDRQKANEAAWIAQNSQAARDVAKYGGGYGALTK